MFAKLSALCVAGAAVVVSGSQVQAQDFFGWNNWGARPAVTQSYPVRTGQGILPGGCYNGQCPPTTTNCANGRCTTVPVYGTAYGTSYGNGCANGQCPPAYGYGTTPYRNTVVQPVYQQPAYRVPAYNTGYNQYQPVVRPVTYNNSPFYQ